MTFGRNLMHVSAHNLGADKNAKVATLAAATDGLSELFSGKQVDLRVVQVDRKRPTCHFGLANRLVFRRSWPPFERTNERTSELTCGRPRSKL